jgi:hypothetical protein
LRKYDSDQYFTIYRQYFFLKIEHFSWISYTVCGQKYCHM